MALLIDPAIALAAAGADPHPPDDGLEAAIRRTTAGRRGYIGPLDLTDTSFRVELLLPERLAFEGRTEIAALGLVPGLPRG